MGGPLFEKLMTRFNVVIKDKSKKRRKKNTNGYGVILTHFDRTVNYVWIIESNTQTVNGIRMMLFVLLIWFVFSLIQLMNLKNMLVNVDIRIFGQNNHL